MRGNPHLNIMEKYDIKVDIVLASYNGEKFIKEQVQSILAQTHSNFNLIISDDNSSDKTKEIVEGLREVDNRIQVVNNNGIKGVVGNFNNGLKYTTSNYIMFSDQDDYWLNDKVEKMLALIVDNEGDEPALAFSDLEVVDQNLVTIHKSYYISNSLSPINNTKSQFLLWRSTCYGCSVIFNRRLFSSAGLVPDYASMHDHWYAYNASILGKVLYHPDATIKYRQHDNNVVGSHDTGLLSKLLRIKKTFKSIKKNVISTSNTVKEINGINDISLRRKLSFIKYNILSFSKERRLYCFVFVILWVVYG